MAKFSDLPEGMVTEILLRLQVKSLLICKSVCKPLLSIISHPHFIKSHLHRAITASRNNPTLLNIVNPQPNEHMLALIASIPVNHSIEQRRRQLINKALLDANSQDLSGSPINFDRIVMPNLFNNNHLVINSYNGIICLSSVWGDVVYLWNPSIRQYKKLPAPTPHTSSPLPVMIGFGYDSISNDYKVIKLVCDKLEDVIPRVQVYSTNDDSWRAFQGPMLKKYKWFHRTNIVVNGVMYLDIGDELMSFHLHNEVLGLVSFSNFIQRKKSNVLNFKGSVAMVFQSGPGIDLWTLDDVSGQSWTKKFGFEADSETGIWLYCYLGAGQFYGRRTLRKTHFLYEVFYDYEKKETKYYGPGEEYVYANLEHPHVPVHGTLEYTKTLVSLDGFEPVE